MFGENPNLSYDDFLKHLAFLVEKKLVKETEEGRRLYIELRKSLPSIL
jgi:predicted transcriptional regulator